MLVYGQTLGAIAMADKADAVRAMDHAVTCLQLELPPLVWGDVWAKWLAVRKLLINGGVCNGR